MVIRDGSPFIISVEEIKEGDDIQYTVPSVFCLTIDIFL